MKENFLKRLKGGLSKTRSGFSSMFKEIFSSGNTIDSETLEELQEILISADVGVQTSDELIEELKNKIDSGGYSGDSSGVRTALKDTVSEFLMNSTEDLLDLPDGSAPKMMLLVGVNGVGKTTTAAKIAYRLKNKNKKTLVCAADTFRAAAIEQLEIWAKKADSDFVKHGHGASPSAVVFDAVSAAKARASDWIIVDTAGRLHTRKNLMDELEKIRRVAAANLEGAPHETLLVLDATTGQNGLLQAKAFADQTPLTGLVLTKLDGTAKGGIVIGIARELDIPIRYVGVGEGIEDLLDFDAQSFAQALFSD